MPYLLEEESKQSPVEEQNLTTKTIIDLRQDYEKCLAALEKDINSVSTNKHTFSQNMPPAQRHAQNIALYEAKKVLIELKKQPSMLINDDKLFLKLTKICQYMRLGLQFLANGEKSFSCDTYESIHTNMKTSTYDIFEHKYNMSHIRSMSQDLKGNGWAKCQIYSAIFAALLVFIGSLITPFIGWIPLTAVLSCAAALMILTLVAGQNTALAGAVSSVKMHTSTMSQDEKRRAERNNNYDDYTLCL